MYTDLREKIRGCGSGNGGHGRNGVKMERGKVGPISTTFESGPRRLSRLVQNADGVDWFEVGRRCGAARDGGAVAVKIAAAIAVAVAAGDPDFLEHTRLLAEFFEARVFFRATVTESRVGEIWE